MASTADVVWVDVLPSMKGFLSGLRNQTVRDAATAGRESGDAYSDNFRRQAVEGVEKASAQLAAARKKEADAAGAQALAMTRLQALVDRGNATTVQLAAANEGLARASRNLEAAHDGVARASTAVTRAQETQNRVTVDGEKSSRGMSGGLLSLRLESDALDRTSTNLGRTLGILTGVAGAAFGALGSQAVVGGVVALGAAVSAASGAILLLPAAAAAVAAPLATFKLGLVGVEDAFKALGKGDMDKFNAALATMAPSAQAVFREVAALKPALDGLRVAVQGEMFAGLAQQVQPLAGVYFPLLRAELGQFGALMASGAVQVAQFMVQGRTVADLTTILTNARVGFGELTGAARPLVSIFTDLAVVGSTFIPNLSGGLTDLAVRTADWVARARESGVLRDIISGSLSVIGQLGQLLVNVGSIITSVFQAGAATGVGFLQVMINATGEVRRFLNSDYGSSMLAQAFGSVGQALSAIMPLVGMAAGIFLGQLVPAFAALGLQLAPIARELMTQLGYALGALLPILPQVGQLIAALVQAFLPWIPLLTQAALVLLPPLLSGLTQLAPVIAPAAAGIFVVVQAMNALNAVQTLSLLATNAWRGAQVLATVATTAWSAAQWVLNTAFMGFPLVWIIAAFAAVTAGLVLLWKNSETFRAVVTAAWEGVQTAIAYAWNSVVKPAWDAMAAAGVWLWNTVLVPAFTGIRAAWDVLAAAFGAAWVNIIRPAWDQFGAAALWLWNTVLVPAFAGMRIAWEATATAFGSTWTSIVKPAWDAMAAAAQFLWNSVLVPAFNGIKTAWDALGAGIQWAWANIIQPTWNFIDTAARYLLAVLATVVFAPILIAWNVLSAGIEAAWNGIIRPAWELMQTAAQFMWNNVLRPTWETVQAAWTALAGLVRAIYETVIQTTWNALQAAAIWMWTNVLQPTWATIQTSWNALALAIRAIYDTVIQPAWNALQAAAQFMWNNVLQPTWAAVQAGWNALATAVRAIYDSVIVPAWNALQAAAQFMWNNVLRPTWDAIRAGWDALGRALRAVYDTIIRPAFDAVMAGVDMVKRAFDTGVNGIRNAWERVREIVAAPIRWVIDVVWNRGVVALWNKVAGVLGISTITPAALNFAAGGQVPAAATYADGGKIRGPWRGPTADNILGVVDNQTPIKVNPREWIQPVAAVDYYGEAAMEAVQYRRVPREVLQYYADGGPIPGYATGQQIFSTVRAAWPQARFTSGYRPGDPGLHGSNQAADIAGPTPTPSGSKYIADIEAWWAANFGQTTTQLIYNGAGDRQGNLLNGRLYPYDAATQAGHRGHVHIGYTGALNGTPTGAVAGPAGTLAQALTPAQILAQLMGQVANIFLTPARALVNAIPFDAPPVIEGVPKQLGTKILDEVERWMRGKADAKAQTMAAAPENQVFSVAATGSVPSIVQAAAATRGWGGAPQWDALAWIIQKESGWRPTAQNPISSASGLFQQIDATWRAYRPASAAGYAKMRLAPVNLQAIAGLNYIASRYGTPTGARAFWQANGWYGGGGQVPAYHTGGRVPDSGVRDVPAWLAPDERVLAPEQDDYFRRFVDIAERNFGPASTAALVGSMDIRMAESDPRVVADEIMHRLQVADRGGTFSIGSAYGG